LVSCISNLPELFLADSEKNLICDRQARLNEFRAGKFATCRRTSLQFYPQLPNVGHGGLNRAAFPRQMSNCSGLAKNRGEWIPECGPINKLVPPDFSLHQSKPTATHQQIMTQPNTNSDRTDFDEIADLCQELTELAMQKDTDANWPAESLDRCAQFGVFRWFVPENLGGLGWNAEQIIQGYLRLSAACLNTTFIITQQTAAVDRICGSSNEELKQKLIPDICTGRIHATVGISHLTTSRQHARRPPLLATATSNGFLIDGYTPWVTAAPNSDWFLMGAVTDDGKQLLFAVEKNQTGIEIGDSTSLMALTGSQTGPVKLNKVDIDRSLIISGPAENLMAGGGGRTGGLPTSTLATGLAGAAIDWIDQQSKTRNELTMTAESLRQRWSKSSDLLLSAARNSPGIDTAKVREQANRLVIDATSAALLAAKGAGYVKGHPVERWCRQAMFFLVWSCPQNVQQSHLQQFTACGRTVSEF
jgi:alkylation response protein AidB-like acyl-CoA dehydrogenase